MSENGTSSTSIEVPDAPSIPGLTFRRYRGKEDHPLFKAVFDQCRVVDKIQWSMTLDDYDNEYAHLVNVDLERDIVVIQHDGQVIGYSQMGWYEELDGKVTYRMIQHVVPEWRGRSVRKALIGYHEGIARVLAEEHPGDGPKFMSAWTSETEQDWLELLKGEGYAPERYFLEMVRDLREPIEDRDIPEDLEVRPVPPGDYRKVFDAANEALKDHWGGRQWTEEEYLEFINAPWFQPELWMIAYDGDKVAGTVINWINEEENLENDRRWGYTEIITVQRPYRGRGLAKALVTKSMLLVRDKGMEFANLGVDTMNPSGAHGLYTGLGYKPIKTYTVYQKPIDMEAGGSG
jgi:GNAT superfamily N-acetyltransferase